MSKNKIAILILAHSNKEQLIRLINHLSSSFDVYVHIDKKSCIKIDLKNDLIYRDNVFIFKKFKVYWGSFNQILATLLLITESKKNNYERYILISGQDLPIKSNKYILDFWNTNIYKSYLEYEKLPRKLWYREDGGLNRMIKFRRLSRRGLSTSQKIFTIPNQIYTGILNLFFKRNLDYQFFGGANWMNLSSECVDKILQCIENNRSYIKRFKHTASADEIFFQTIILNLNDKLELVNNNLRYTFWEEGKSSPKTLTLHDYDDLIKSDSLFARKFNSTEDSEIIEKIYSFINKDEEKP